MSITDGILPDLPEWPSGFPFLIFSRGQWLRIGQAFQTVHNEHEALIEMMGPIITALETITMALDALKVEITGLKQDVAELGQEVISEISDLAAAVANGQGVDPAIQDAVDTLVETRGRVQELVTSLRADNAAPAPTPEPDGGPVI